MYFESLLTTSNLLANLEFLMPTNVYLESTTRFAIECVLNANLSKTTGIYLTEVRKVDIV